ncbi:MAG: ATP-binding cassette domain-containing protein [Verrucomicrobia bacterium]|nr:ATP-binding cassette domain-containing protein [Verrucomicrobiota bacterium]
MKQVIRVDKLTKRFIVRSHFPGVLGALKGLFFSKRSEVAAIQEISFAVHAGERLAFIGPNGAGKSTTIKMLTGILHPSDGGIEVLGMTPWKNRMALGYRIGTVFGQRTQLWHHLPPSDTFSLLAKIYEIDEATYQKRLKELIEVFEIGPFFHKAVRQLSLGERMRCELVASLLHQPEILFLDEPTIGLDVNAKLKIRGLLKRLSEVYGTTLFLTSHDTADIEQVCDRAIVLDQGKIILDSSIKELKKATMKKKILSLTTDEEKLVMDLPGIHVLENRNYHFVCEVNLADISIDKVIQETLKRTSLKDVTIEDPSMEEIIRNLYTRENRHG